MTSMQIIWLKTMAATSSTLSGLGASRMRWMETSILVSLPSRLTSFTINRWESQCYKWQILQVPSYSRPVRLRPANFKVNSISISYRPNKSLTSAASQLLPKIDLVMPYLRYLGKWSSLVNDWFLVRGKMFQNLKDLTAEKKIEWSVWSERNKLLMSTQSTQERL